MRGSLIHFNAQAGQGLIRAEDGRRYAFVLGQWRSESYPTLGDELDFEIEGTRALDIYVTREAVAPAYDPPPPERRAPPPPREAFRPEQAPRGPRAAPPPRGSLGGESPPRAPRSAPPPRERVPVSDDAPRGPAFGGRLLSHWTAILALVALLGCAMPYVSVGGQFGFGSTSSSLLGIGNLGSQMLDLLDTGRRLDRVFNNQQRPLNAQQQREQEKIESLRWKIRISYILYVVPLLALAVIVVQGIGMRLHSLTVLQALATIAIPIAVPLIYYALVNAEVPQAQRQNVLDVLKLLTFSFTGIGFWVMILAGILQLLNVMGLFRKGPRDLFGGMAAASAGASSSASYSPRRAPPEYSGQRPPPEYSDRRPPPPEYRVAPRYADEPGNEPPPQASRPPGGRRPPPSRERL